MMRADLSRRHALGLIGASAVAGAFPRPALAAGGGVRKPPRLRPGDTIGLVEPAGYTRTREDLDALLFRVRGMGLVPKTGSNVLSRYGYLAGTDEQRAADINAMYADPEVKAVMATRGGWGGARILPLLDWDVIRANPKLLIGFSDVTSLHLAFARHAGFATIHGPNAANSWPAPAWESFWRIAFSGETPTYRLPEDAPDPLVTINGGRASGPLLGGNLTVLAAITGSAYMPDFEGAILFLEDTGEAPYRIDRMLTQLTLAGILGKLAGVVFGNCRRCNPPPDEPDAVFVTDVLKQHFEPLGIPAFMGARIGHIADQISLPVGVRAEIDADVGTIRMLEAAVS